MLLEVQNLTKNLGGQQILKGLSFTSGPGEVCCLLGPNGAGKTTLMGCLAGLRIPDQGTVRVSGLDPRTLAGRHLFTVSPQEIEFPKSLRVSEIVDFYLSHFPKSDMNHYFEVFRLSELWTMAAGSLSGGQRRRVSLACVFAAQTPVVFLDEPSAGLDTEMRQALWQVILAKKEKGACVFVTTHYLEEAEALASKVIVLEKGLISFSGEPTALMSQLARGRVSFVSDKNLSSLTSVREFRVIEGRYVLLTDSPDQLVRELIASQVEFSDLRVTSPGLEEALSLLYKRGEVRK